ncbi:MAG: hypothetical protein ABW148_10640 [Sedimenticola sp.]
MNDNGPSRNFLLGNVILGVALLTLLYIGKLWELMGPAAMGLWTAIAGLGIYLLMKDKD